MQESQKIDVHDHVMEKITSRIIEMKPKWYFAIGGTVWFVGLFSLVVFLVFVVQRILFQNLGGGAVPAAREGLFNEFPMFGLPIAVLALVLGTSMCRRYDFISSRFHPVLLFLGFSAAVLFAGIFIHFIGLGHVFFNAN